MGQEVSSAASVASQSASCQLCAVSSAAGLRGDVRFRVSAGLASEQKRVQSEHNRVVYEIEAQSGVSLNKIGLSVMSTLWGPSLSLFRGFERRKNGLGCCAYTRRSGFRRQKAIWRRFADVRKRAPSRRYPILFRNRPGVPDFVNFPIYKVPLRDAV